MDHEAHEAMSSLKVMQMMRIVYFLTFFNSEANALINECDKNELLYEMKYFGET